MVHPGRVPGFSHPGELRVVVVTNVEPSNLRTIVAPLIRRRDIGSLSVVRDAAGPELGAKVTYLLPRSLSRTLVGRIAGRIARLLRHMRRCRPDVLMLIHWFPDAFYAMPLAAFFGVPVVGHIVGGRAELRDGARKVALTRLPLAVKWTAERLTKASLRRARVLTFTGGETREWYERQGVVGPRMVVLRAEMLADDAPRAWAERRTHIAYVGRVDADKRFDRCLRALRRVAERMPDLCVEVAGIGEPEARVLPDFESLKSALGDRLRFLGQVPHETVQDLLTRSLVLLLTSDSEGKSLAMLEAMSHGTVPVVTRVGDLAEVIEQSEGGIAVPLTGNEEENALRLAEATLGLLAGPDVWTARSRNAWRFVQREHGPTATADDWNEILTAIRQGSHVPGRDPFATDGAT